MKYTIIIPYRNREQHLQTLLPRLLQKFEGKDYEIIIAEQDESGPFCKTVLMNTAAKFATGDVFIFHDVDYYPMDNVSYDYDEDVGIYPVRNVIFLDENGAEMPDDRIPGGYRTFKYDVGDHSGGVVIVSKKHFGQMNGFNPAYRGWGKEDDDFLVRFDYHGILRKRNNQGTFLALYHADSAPPDNDADYTHNKEVIQNFLNTYWMGYAHTSCNVEVFDSEIPNVRWLKMKNCGMVTKLLTITLPTRKRVRSLARTMESLEKTIINKSDVEIVFKVDDDDAETIEYLNKTTFPFETLTILEPRDPVGYRNIGLWQSKMSSVARGKLIAPIGDDWVFDTYGWDMILAPYQDKFGLVYAKDDEGAPFGVALYITATLYRTMWWYGTHPYIDRWFDAMLKMYPMLKLDTVDIQMRHIKDNAESQTPDMEPITNVLSPEQIEEWAQITKRVGRHINILNGVRPQ
jgi:hypothetical protein